MGKARKNRPAVHKKLLIFILLRIGSDKSRDYPDPGEMSFVSLFIKIKLNRGDFCQPYLNLTQPLPALPPFNMSRKGASTLTVFPSTTAPEMLVFFTSPGKW